MYRNFYVYSIQSIYIYYCPIIIIIITKFTHFVCRSEKNIMLMISFKNIYFYFEVHYLLIHQRPVTVFYSTIPYLNACIKPTIRASGYATAICKISYTLRTFTDVESFIQFVHGQKKWSNKLL